MTREKCMWVVGVFGAEFKFFEMKAVSLTKSVIYDQKVCLINLSRKINKL